MAAEGLRERKLIESLTSFLGTLTLLGSSTSVIHLHGFLVVGISDRMKKWNLKQGRADKDHFQITSLKGGPVPPKAGSLLFVVSPLSFPDQILLSSEYSRSFPPKGGGQPSLRGGWGRGGKRLLTGSVLCTSQVLPCEMLALRTEDGGPG